MMSLSVWLPFALVCLLGAMSPGPSLATVIRNTVVGSRFHGIVTGISHAIGIGAYAMFSITGLVFLIQEAPLIFRGLTWFGAVYLAWLGLQGLMSRASVATPLAPETSSTGITRAALDGLMISMLNPKIIAFFVALFSQFVDQASSTLNSFIMVLTPMFIDGTWYCFISIIVSQSFLIHRLREKAVWLDRTIGVMLILMALRIFFIDTPF